MVGEEEKTVAELYPPGIQTIYYRAARDENLVVTAKLIDPFMVVGSILTFSKLPGAKKIYYANVDFYAEGIWMAIFYENGEEKTVQAYNTKKIPAEGEFRIRGGYKGPNVIG